MSSGQCSSAWSSLVSSLPTESLSLLQLMLVFVIKILWWFHEYGTIINNNWLIIDYVLVMKWLYHDEKGAHQQDDFAISPPERLDKRSFASFRFRPKGNFSGWYIMAWIMTGNTSNNGWKSGYNIFLFFKHCNALHWWWHWNGPEM